MERRNFFKYGFGFLGLSATAEITQEENLEKVNVICSCHIDDDKLVIKGKEMYFTECPSEQWENPSTCIAGCSG